MPTKTGALTTALDKFYRIVDTRLQLFHKQRKKKDLYKATQFSLFDYVHRDENRLSDVIQALLDPVGKHGQGALFLNSFLEAIGVPPRRSHAICRVKREDPAAYCSKFQRRIDITLHLGDFGVGIENKPWADDGADQLKDYSRHLQGKYGENFKLVYLSGDGSAPTSLGKTDLSALQASEQFKSLSYPTDICRWLERCIQDCKAPKVRWFLEDFAKYVKEKFAISDEEEEPLS